MEWIGLANYAVFMAIFICIYALLSLGLNIQWGFTGLFNCPPVPSTGVSTVRQSQLRIGTQMTLADLLGCSGNSSFRTKRADPLT